MDASNFSSQNTISVVAVTESDLRAEEPRTPVLRKIGVSDLANNLKTFLGQLDQVLHDLNNRVGGFEVDELEVYAEVTAEGQVSLLGTGIQSGATGGLKLILRRPASGK
jgi:hypothetical protein